MGIGGGSALDLAKAARLLADAGGSLWDYLEGGRPFAPPSLPLVLCPTTSGTGSEVSGASVLTDTDRDRKVGIANGLMRAQHALVDPLLTLGLPPGPTAHSGVDALAQAIGACTVRDGSPLSVAFGLEAAHHVGRSLERAVADGSDRDARRQLACGSLTGGLVDEPLRLRCRPRARPGDRLDAAPAARPHDRARAGRDARSLARRPARRGWSASPTRWASRTTARATARAP